MMKLMILMLVVAFVGMFFIKGPDGEPLMTLDDLSPAKPAVLESPPEPTTVYKWQDEKGVWQFSSRPPDGTDAEAMELDGNINTMATFDITKETGLNKPGVPQQEPSSMASIPSGLTSVSPEKIGEMMDTINSLQDTLDQRKTDIDKATGRDN